MKRLNICLLAISGILFGCTSTSVPDEDNILHLENVLYEEVSSCVEDFGMLSFQPLATNDSCLLTEYSTLGYAGSKGFIISDMRGIYRFAPNGDFLNPIGHQGDGPYDYVGTRCVSVDPELEKVYAWDDKGVMVYDFEGKYLTTLPLAVGRPHQGFGVAFGDSLFAFERQYYGEHGLKCRMIYADSEGTEKDSVEFYSDTVRVKLVLPGIIWFWRNDTRWLHKEQWSMEVNEVTPTGTKRLFTMDFGHNTRTRASFQDANVRINEGDYIKHIGDYVLISGKEHLWLEVGGGKHWVKALYNLKDHKTEFSKNMQGLPKRERGLPSNSYNLTFWPDFVDQEGNAIMLLPPDQLDSNLMDMLQQQFPQLKVTEESNYIIVKLSQNK